MVEADMIDDDYVDRFTDKSSRMDDSDYIYVPDKYGDDDSDFERGGSSRNVLMSRPNTKLPNIKPACMITRQSKTSNTDSSGKHLDHQNDEEMLDFPG